MISRFRLFASLACALTVQLSADGVGGPFASPSIAGDPAECADPGKSGSAPMGDEMDMSGNADCSPSPCNGDMPDGACRTMPGCIAGAWVAPTTVSAATMLPTNTRPAETCATALLSLAIAPAVPPPRA